MALRNELNPKELNPDAARPLRMVTTVEEEKQKVKQFVDSKPIEMQTIQELLKTALTYNEHGDYHIAKKCFVLARDKTLADQTLTSDEKNSYLATCHYGIGNVYRELDEAGIATDHFKLALKKVPHTNQKLKYEIQRNLGIAYLKLDEFIEAKNCFKEAIAIATEMKQDGLIPAVKSYYGLSLVFCGETELGFATLKEARELFPHDKRENSMDWASHQYHMGRAYQGINDHANAINEFNGSLRLREKLLSSKIGSLYVNSRLADVRLGLGYSYLALGDFFTAKTWLTEALKNFQAMVDARQPSEFESLGNKSKIAALTATLDYINGLDIDNAVLMTSEPFKKIRHGIVWPTQPLKSAPKPPAPTPSASYNTLTYGIAAGAAIAAGLYGVFRCITRTPANTVTNGTSLGSTHSAGTGLITIDTKSASVLRHM